MNKTQLRKEELQKEQYKLETEYKNLQIKYDKLQSQINSNFMVSILCGISLGIPIIYFGLKESISFLLILGGGIMSLCLVFGFESYKKKTQVEKSQHNINVDMHNIFQKMDEIKNKIKQLKTINIVITKLNKSKVRDYDTPSRIIDNCFYTLLKFFDDEEKKILLNNKENIDNYIEEFDKLQDIIHDLDFISYKEMDENECIEIEESIVKDIIYEYISGVKEIFQIFLSENYGYEDFIKNNQLTYNGIIGQRILEKLSLLETEYTT